MNKTRPQLISDTEVFHLIKILSRQLEQRLDEVSSFYRYYEMDDDKVQEPKPNKVYVLDCVYKILLDLKSELRKAKTALISERQVWDGELKDNDVVEVNDQRYHFARIRDGYFHVYYDHTSKYTSDGTLTGYPLLRKLTPNELDKKKTEDNS